MTLSTQPYKGSRDFYPEDWRIMEYIFSVWCKVSEKYGYEKYNAPLLEPYEVYAAKTGDEIVSEQTYVFEDRGERRVVIRPEMTPTVSRMVAAKRQELAYPVRWYSVANFMRYERPQRGREREFWQLNADIFGVATIDADVEVIAMADDLMRAFGATNDMYAIKVNSRELVNFIMNKYLGLDAAQAQKMIKLLDRKAKMSASEFDTQAKSIFGPDEAPTGQKKLNQILAVKDVKDLPSELQACSAVGDLQQLFTMLESLGISSLAFDIGLMRGFDYYTDIVFEVFDLNPENPRALFGGGRYDGLVGLFGVESVQAVGYAPGATTTADFLTTHKLLPKFTPSTDLYIVVWPGAMQLAQKVAAELRNKGVNIELDITGRKPDKQLKTAVKRGLPYALFIGEKDAGQNAFELKDLVSGASERRTLDQVAAVIK